MAATGFKDYYALLGVSRTASTEEIKQSFRKLARQYHPDVNPGDQGAEAKFKEVSEAYEVLSDPDKRKKYDQFGQYWQQADRAGGGAYGGAPGDFGGFDFSAYGSFDEFINELLGRFAGGVGVTAVVAIPTAGLDQRVLGLTPVPRPSPSIRRQILVLPLVRPSMAPKSVCALAMTR